MALSNIFNEPQREIIETLIGLAIMTVPCFLSYRLALYYVTLDPTIPFGIALALAALSLIFGLMVAGGLALVTHFVGEEICDRLADRGLEIRPKDRR